MQYRKYLLFLTSFAFYSLVFVPFAHASILGDLLDKAQKLFVPTQGEDTQSVSVTSQISLAPRGDINENGQVDAGDTLRFFYTLKNSTDVTYPFVTLETHVPRNQLNFIHNIVGASGITEKNSSIQIVNLVLLPHQSRNISFDARTNFITGADVLISTQAEVIASDHKPLANVEKKELRVKALPKLSQPSLLKSQHTTQ
jgi:hypothetical protein